MGRDEVSCWIESGTLPISVVGATLTGPISSTGWNERAAQKQRMTEKHSRKMAQGSQTGIEPLPQNDLLRLITHE